MHGITVAIIPCLAAYIQTTVLVSLIFGTSIATSFTILMKCVFFTVVSLVFHCM